MDILEKLHDLHRQATVEHTVIKDHVALTILEAIAEISNLHEMTKDSTLKSFADVITENVIAKILEKEDSINPWEKACKEFLKGCSYAAYELPESCKACLKAFCDKLRLLEKM